MNGNKDILAKWSVCGWNLARVDSPSSIINLCKDAGWIGVFVLICLMTLVVSSVASKTDYFVSGT